MPKRLNSLITVSRIIELLFLLPKGAGHALNTRQVLERLTSAGFEVNKRTVERDLKSLRERSEFPLCSDKRSDNAHYWYFPDTAPQMSIPHLSSEEALAFHVLKRFAVHLIPDSVANELSPFFDMANRVLRDQSRTRLTRWKNKVHVTAIGMHFDFPTIKPAVLTAVHKALFEERPLQAQYTALGYRKPGSLLLHPWGVFYRRGLAYLVANRDARDRQQVFALHRFAAATVDEGATAYRRPPGDFDLADYVENNFMTRMGQDIKLQARFQLQAKANKKALAARNFLREVRLGADQQLVDNDDGSFDLTVTVADSSDLRIWLRRFAGEVEVLSPAKLRAEFRADARRQWELYAKR